LLPRGFDISQSTRGKLENVLLIYVFYILLILAGRRSDKHHLKLTHTTTRLSRILVKVIHTLLVELDFTIFLL